MKRILITGHAGFIGSNFAKKCCDEGLIVSGVDDMSNGHEEFIPSGMHESIVGCFSSYKVLKRIRNQQYDVVVHLAAVPRVSYSVEYPVKTNDINVTRTLQLMDACKNNVDRFVFASSSSVYGGADKLPTSEMHQKNPKSPYALQKSVIEDYLTLYNDHYGLDSVCLRFFNVFGKNQVAGGPYATAISSWLDAIKRGKPMRSDGDGTQSRDLCHVDNVVDACLKSTLHKGTLDAMRLNVACGSRTSNIDILRYMLKRYPNATKVDAPWRAGDVLHTHADISAAKEALGYVPLVLPWEGIEKTCDWFDENWSWIKDLRQGM